MRKLFLVISALVGLVVIGIAALVFYAAISLDSIIAANRDRILNSRATPSAARSRRKQSRLILDGA